MGKKHQSEFESKEVSRRSFLCNTGKLIGIGALSHFALIGKARANDVPEGVIARAGCTKAQVCEDKKYTCGTGDVHTCSKGQFSCGTGFTCTPVNTNQCVHAATNACVPASAYTNE